MKRLNHTNRSHRNAAQRLLAQQQRLVREIDHYLEKNDPIPGTGKKGLRQIEVILLNDIEEIKDELGITRVTNVA